MHSFVAEKESLRIGSVIAVSPEDIEVQLDADAPDSIALNAGAPRGFPRINGYLLIPNEIGFTVGQVAWIKIVNSPYSNRHDFKDVGLIDLPFSRRIVSLSPVGTLVYGEDREEVQEHFAFHRGVETFPSVGDCVLLPTATQLTAIVTAGKNLRVKIGTSPLAANVDVKIDPDRLFGRHLAVLGNTGSGKSCSVAGLIRWSLEAARGHVAENSKKPCAKFIILDPNGEYRSAYQDMGAQVFAVEPDNVAKQLRLPYWLLNADEWCSLVQASGKTQRPALLEAIRMAKTRQQDSSTPLEIAKIRRMLGTHLATIRYEEACGDPWGKYPKPKSFLDKLKNIQADFAPQPNFTRNQNDSLEQVRNAMASILEKRADKYASPVVSQTEIEKLLECLECAFHAFGGQDACSERESVSDAPIPFPKDNLIQLIEGAAELTNTTAHVETLLLRIRTLLSDEKLKKVMFIEDRLDLESILTTFMGIPKKEQITILDLSLLPSSVVHTIAAVIARLIMDALQRYRKLSSDNSLPTLLVLEEAHTFISRRAESIEMNAGEEMCCRIFERIAREGRKFGLGLVLSSQRPSELSPTVLSQCNSFLLHRITNDRDQDLLRRLLPDNMQGLLRELPTLSARNAILLGWASELPTLVRMDELAPAHQPQSQDPQFWDVWTRKNDSKTNWQVVVDDWLSPSIVSRNESTESSPEKVPPVQ